MKDCGNTDPPLKEIEYISNTQRVVAVPFSSFKTEIIQWTVYSDDMSGDAVTQSDGG